MLEQWLLTLLQFFLSAFLQGLHLQENALQKNSHKLDNMEKNNNWALINSLVCWFPH